MMNINFNTEKNGIEVSFESKPTADVLQSLKENGFRWSNRGKFWYVKDSEEKREFLKNLASGEAVTMNKAEKKNSKNNEIDIFELTRVDNLENNYKKYHIMDCKEIAKIIRVEVRKRFPMCKFSVRMSGYRSIDINIKTSPFAKDSEILKAIAHYIAEFADSYNYDNSDLYTDYFDVNFYGCYEGSMIDYSYEQREATAEEIEMEKRFNKSLNDFKIEEERKMEERIAEQRKQREIDEKLYAEQEKKEKEHKNKIENNSIIENKTFFIKNCLEPDFNKFNNVDEAEFECNRKAVCKVTRVVCMTEDDYYRFCKMLLTDFSFLENMGGTETADRRVNDMLDYEKMDEEERRTVEWFNTNCVAISVNGNIGMVVNPEGYSYARYVYFVTAESEIVEAENMENNKGISDKEHNEGVRNAERIVDEAIECGLTVHSTLDDMTEEDFFEFKRKLENSIRENKLVFNNNIIGYMSEISYFKNRNIVKFKEIFYKILTDVEKTSRQFEKADLKTGDEISIMKLDGFGVGFIHGIFSHFEAVPFAQYNNNVKLYFYDVSKRNKPLSYINIHSDFLVYRGFLNVPESLYWETKENNGITTSHSKFTMFDRKYLDITMEYFNKKNVYPIVNTYKTIF